MATAAIDQGALLEAALAYSREGLPVFPCRSDNKRPWTKHGFKDASTDEQVVRAWWARWPDAMIGVPTGEAIGAWVLDVDEPEAFEAACTIALPATRRCTTGKGWHAYFRCQPGIDIRNAQRDNKGRWPFPELPGAEVRGTGGYVILPPSLHPNGRHYRWSDDAAPAMAPAELVAIVTRQKSNDNGQSTRPLAGNVGSGGDTAYGLAALDQECAAIRSAGEGSQESALNSAALKIGALVAGGELTNETARGQLIAAGLVMPSYNARDPWTAEAVLRKIERGLADGARNPRNAPERLWFEAGSREQFDPVTGEVFEDDEPAPKRARKTKGAEVSEDSIAAAFTAKYGATLRYDRDRGRWYEWDGFRWQQDDLDRAFHYTRTLARELGGGERTLCKAGVARGVEAFARADPVHAVNSSTWDADPMLLGTPGGTVDLRTGLLRPADPHDFITKQTAVTPDAGEPVRWLRFLDESLAGDDELIEFIRRWCGYCLTGETSAHALVFAFGPGGNGKSVFLNTMAAIIGDYATVAAMDTFTASRNERHPTELAMLQGARLVTSSETEEGRKWADAKVKALTGGDPISARFMRQDHFTFRPQFKLMIAGNHLPQLSNVDDAMRRRLNLVPFVNRPARKDEELMDKLKAEHGQILRWAVEGCLAWRKGGLARPEAVNAATDSYFEEQDLFGQWIDDRCIVDPGKWELPAKLYQSWCSYAKEAGDEPGPIKTMKPRLERRGFRSAKTSGMRVYRGLALREATYGDARDA